MKMVKALSIALSVFCFTTILQAQDMSSTDTPQVDTSAVAQEVAANLPSFGMGLEFGTVTIDSVTYNTIHLQPDFHIGKFGVGLDLNFEFDGDFNLRKDDWTGWQNILAKIMYISWGSKFDKPVYAKIGNINDFTIGHGLIMYRYSNMLNYPASKNLGAAFDLDLGVFGLETMMGSLNFDVFGFRAFGRPLYNTKIPIVKSLEVGASLVMDVNPYALAGTATNSLPAATNVYVYGGDLSAIVLDNGLVTMKTYLDFIGISGFGSGEVLGVAGKIVKAVPYRFEVRYNQPHFMFTYFDQFYDATRATKLASLDAITNGYAGMYFSSGIGLFPDEKTKIDRLVWSLSVEDSFSDEILPTMTMDLILTKALLKKFALDFTFVRKNIYYFSDIFKSADEDMILMLNLQYYISDNLSLVVDYKRTFELAADGTVQPFTSTSISTKFSF